MIIICILVCVSLYCNITIMFLIIFAVMIGMGILERVYPRVELPYKKGWILRAVFFNALQLLISIFGYYTWEHWIAGGQNVFHLDQNMSPFYGGLVAYFINTLIFYWWHRIRHESKTMWLLIHQFHHSPERIEIITSFYKHPIEIMLNSIIISILVYPILGLSVEANAWLTLFSALGEFVYHVNIRTPYWMGYFIQRPESHCLHHIRDKRYCYNHADLPIWDILGGTFLNPTEECKIGFSNNAEEKVKDMMMFKDVVRQKSKHRIVSMGDIMYVLFIILSCASAIGYVANSDSIRGIGFASATSPLPFVFSAYNGEETFSTIFELDIILKNGSHINQQIDNKLYGKLKGPYNRKNVYGAIFSHGVFFDKENLINIRQQILEWGFCGGFLSREFGIDEPIKTATISVRTKSNDIWKMNVTC